MSISIEDRIFEVAEDIRGLRLPMPPPLEWVNAYFLRDTNGWLMVDSGYNRPDSRAVLQEMIDNHLDGLPITGVLITHYHPDHVGQAGWVCEKFGCPLYMNFKEWLLARWLSTDKTETYLNVVSDYYRAAGTPQPIMDFIRERGNTFIGTADEVPSQVHRLEEGQILKIGAREWQVIIGRGHAPEMVLLYDKAGKLLISADQVVARITPNVSIWAFDPYADPLKEFLETSANLPKMIPNDVTILPGHGRTFDDFHGRLASYLTFHDNRLQKLLDGMSDQPQSLHELHKILFPRELSPRDYVFALGETHSHVNYLMYQGVIRKLAGADMMYQKI